MRLIDANALYDSYLEEMRTLIESTNNANISEEALSLLCGSKLITDAPTIGGWISVKDRLPMKRKQVLVYSITHGVRSDFIDWSGRWYTVKNVTHWMPLPEPPKEEQNEESNA